MMRLVLIEWEDSSTLGGWQDLTCEIEDAALLCRSVGWLVLDGEKAKVLAPHVHSPGEENFQGSGMMTIPARAILSIRDISDAN